MAKYKLYCHFCCGSATENFQEAFIRIREGFYIHHSVDFNERLSNIFYLRPEFFEEYGKVWHFEDLSNSDLTGMIPKEEYELFTTRGYCQGDYAKVLVHRDAINVPDSEFGGYIDHVFWDCPLYISVQDETTDKEIFFFCDYLDDWDKKELILDILSNNSIKEDEEEELKKFLEEKLPEDAGNIPYI